MDFTKAAEGLKSLGVEVRNEGHRLLFHMPGHMEWVIFHTPVPEFPGDSPTLKMEVRAFHEVFLEQTFLSFTGVASPHDGCWDPLTLRRRP